MSLTTSDLKSIKGIVDTSANRLEVSFIKRIDELDDTLSIQMENGLQEVRDQIGEVKKTVTRIEKAQLYGPDSANRRSVTVKNIRKFLS